MFSLNGIYIYLIYTDPTPFFLHLLCFILVPSLLVSHHSNDALTYRSAFSGNSTDKDNDGEVTVVEKMAKQQIAVTTTTTTTSMMMTSNRIEMEISAGKERKTTRTNELGS